MQGIYRLTQSCVCLAVRRQDTCGNRKRAGSLTTKSAFRALIFHVAFAEQQSTPEIRGLAYAKRTLGAVAARMGPFPSPGTRSYSQCYRRATRWKTIHR